MSGAVRKKFHLCLTGSRFGINERTKYPIRGITVIPTFQRTVASKATAQQKDLENVKYIFPEGLHSEAHSIKTSDGYFLTLFRIRRGRDKNEKNQLRRRPVLLVHGFQCSGVSWFLTSPHKSLPYALVDNGYDCWIANLRGSPYSKRHALLSTTSSEYWDFSWHEMGCYDVPEMVDYILSFKDGEAESAHHDALHYIGHSMGCTVFFVAMFLKPELSSKIKTMTALSPAVLSKHMRNPTIKWGIAPLGSALGRFKNINRREIFRNSLQELARQLCPPFTNPEVFQHIMTNKFASIVNRLDAIHFYPGHVAKMVAHWPQSTSFKTMIHGMQCISSNRFQSFDYGSIENVKKYGKTVPPAYNFLNVKCPVATFYGKNDSICTEADVSELSQQLPILIGNYGVPKDNFSHGDFLFGKNAYELLYQPVLKIILNADR